jgi:hypothetical protein
VSPSIRGAGEQLTGGGDRPKRDEIRTCPRLARIRPSGHPRLAYHPSETRDSWRQADELRPARYR